MKLKTFNKLTALFLIELILILPVYSAALTISNIQVDKTDKSAIITWETDADSSTGINYGTDAANLNNSISDITLAKNHSVVLRNLAKSTSYFFELIAQTPTQTLIDNSSGEFYKFTTLAEDTVAPFINVVLPEFVDTNDIDIIGQTEINTKIELFVNGQIRRVVDFADGEITFYGVDLLPNQQNVLLINAVDAAGNTAQKQFNVFSDLIAPEITLTPALPDVLDARAINIVGKLTEAAFVNITLNSQSVYSAETAAFSYSAQLNEGSNNLIIKATDKAGHEAVLQKTIIADTLPPAITNVTPVSGSFYYEGRAIIDLQLATEPNAEVRVYKDARGALAKYDEAKIADANGNVRFDDIELEGTHFGPYSVSAEWPPLRQVQSTTATTLSYQSQQLTEASERPVRLIIAVRDLAGHVTTHIMNYQIGTCWSGELDFQVLNLLEYNTPTLLSPERLEEGSELISFVLNINYSGQAKKEDWKITSIDIDKACRGGRLGEPEFFLEEDIRYDVSCSILPSSPKTKDSNNDKTLWYIRYDLASTSEFTNFTEPTWDEIGRRELIFPLKLTVRYQEREFDAAQNREIWKTKTQVKCMSVAYFVDIPIDPRDVLPDFLLYDVADALNDTVEVLDELINGTEQVTEYVAMGCLGSLVARFIARAGRNVACRLESQSSIAKKALNQPYTCPITEEQRMSLPLDKDSRKGSTQPLRPSKTIDQNPPNAALTLKLACPACAGWWESEAGLYQLERWLCDRVFCHKAPARWTGYDKGVQDQDIKLAETESKACGAESKAGVIPLDKKENCNVVYKDRLLPGYDNKYTCYIYEGTLYVEDNVKYSPVGDVYTLAKASERGSGPKELKVIKEGSNYATAIKKTCAEICSSGGINKNVVVDTATKGCETEEACVKPTKDMEAGTTAGYSYDECWVSQNAVQEKEQCCCRTKKKEEPKTLATQVNCQPGQIPGQACQGWEYREAELNKKDKTKYGTYYPENRYFEGRDTSACFGANYLFESPEQGQKGSQPTLDPLRQHLSAFQCLCLTGIRQRLLMLKNILGGMVNCLVQIRTTGEADAGVCKEMFTQYVCDLIYQAYIWFKEGCSPFSHGDDKGAEAKGNAESNPFATGFGEFFGSLNSMGSALQSEYGGTQFSNFLGGGEQQFARKICLAAFGFDVGLDFDTFMDMTYATQFATSVMMLGSRRDFLTYNPDNKLATYAYRTSWVIYPGCEIQSYKIDLTCVNNEERSKYRGIDCTVSADEENANGCDCLMSPAPYGARSRTFTTGGPLAQHSSEDKNYNMNAESQYRYDHYRLQLFLNPQSNPSVCLPEGHEDGIFYFPIDDRTARDLLDCTVDVENGLYTCSRGLQWEQKGEAYFDYFDNVTCGFGKSCNLLCKDPFMNQWVDCDYANYDLGKNIEVKVKVKGKGKQCLKAALTSESGEKVYDQVHDVGQSGFETEFTQEKIFSLGSVRSDLFAGTGVSISSKTANCTIVELSKEGTQEAGRTIDIDWVQTMDAGTAKFKPENISSGLQTFDQSGTPVSWLAPKTLSEIEKYKFNYAGFNFKFTDIKQGRCTIETIRGTGKDDQLWSLSLELLHPRDSSCSATTDRIFVEAEDTSISKQLKVAKRYAPKYYTDFKCIGQFAYISDLKWIYLEDNLDSTGQRYEIRVDEAGVDDVIGYFSVDGKFTFTSANKGDVEKDKLYNIYLKCKELSQEKIIEEGYGIDKNLPGTDCTYREFFDNCNACTPDKSDVLTISNDNANKEADCAMWKSS